MEQHKSFVNGEVSFWFRDIGYPEHRPALPGPRNADVAIVGAGLSGLWSAYYLKQARPDWDICIIEKNFAGFGASGRNGGWLSGEPAGKFRHYAKTHGTQAAIAQQKLMFAAIDEILAVAHKHGIDADIEKDGLIHVALNPAQVSRLKVQRETLLDQGWEEDDMVLMSQSELGDRVNIAGALGGFWTPHCARVHPAKLVTRLARVVESMGVQIYEQTAVEAIGSVRVETQQGDVTARYIVSALEGYSDSLNGEQRRLLPLNSSMVVTEILPDSVWEEIGWSGAELVGDAAHSFAYSHRTLDGRIALGGRGVPYNFRSGYKADGKTDMDTVKEIADKLTAMFPVLKDYGYVHGWSGILGVPRDWSAAVQFDASTGIGKLGGYVGHGLTGTNLAARTLRDLILNEDTELARLPWVDRTARRWEPEPLRWLGANAIYAAYNVADKREDASNSTKSSSIGLLANRISGRW